MEKETQKKLSKKEFLTQLHNEIQDILNYGSSTIISKEELPNATDGTEKLVSIREIREEKTSSLPNSENNLIKFEEQSK